MVRDCPEINCIFVRHVLHALDIMGPDHVGIGSDYDGVSPDKFMAVPHPGKIKMLWEAHEPKEK